MPTTVLDLRPVAGYIGAEVLGVDLAQRPEQPVAEALRVALDTHLVLFFADQRLGRAGLKAATTIFGPLVRVPYITAMAEDPDIVAVLKQADETDIAVFGGDWHSDFSFLERPPGGSLLYALDVPPYGGDTMWSNQIAAYETLAAGLKDEIDGRGAIHTGAPYGIAHALPDDVHLSRSIGIARDDPEADRERVHPAVRTHPRSGRKALFVNPIYTTRLDGLSIEQSRPILRRIYRHATRPDFTCRFRWSPGCLAVWDNRTTLHYAIEDYDGHRRLMHRTTFAGEKPV